MKPLTIAVIGGGAAGLVASALLTSYENCRVLLFERNDRLGKKLSATGNGQGNITHRALSVDAYFAQSALPKSKVARMLSLYDDDSVCAFFQTLGVLTDTDVKGRVYPSGRQASAVTDALRFSLGKNVDVRLQTKVTGLEKQANGFMLTAETQDGVCHFFADYVLLCTGGKAAKNFGTDGSAYALAEGLGHSRTALCPSLVQLKTDVKAIRTLKGIRVADGGVTAYVNGEKKATLQGDIIFTDYGVSGDAIFRISAYIADKIDKGVTLSLDLLPRYTQEELISTMRNKRERFPELGFCELLGGTLNNQVGRAVLKTVKDGDIPAAAKAVKAFPLTVTGTLGFDYAQVTKGGIPLDETDDTLQSTLVQGLYFAGETLDIDGACGGYNLQWAYTSARIVVDALIEKIGK